MFDRDHLGNSIVVVVVVPVDVAVAGDCNLGASVVSVIVAVVVVHFCCCCCYIIQCIRYLVVAVKDLLSIIR